MSNNYSCKICGIPADEFLSPVETDTYTKRSRCGEFREIESTVAYFQIERDVETSTTDSKEKKLTASDLLMRQ